MLLNPSAPLGAIDAEILLRLGAAALIGLLLGFDREVRGHAAGLRTHGLVCFSAAAMTISVIALYLQLGAPNTGSRMDPLRIFEAAGSFVGIIGAGLIVFSKGRLRNLTTAANLWLAAVVGIACGAGQWPLVAVGTAISLVMITALRLLEDRMERKRRNGARQPSDDR
ncbi:MgtC/SapB family transporter [Erythrobacter sp. SG61-1L]|uniref:MgtC/SapB family protein n=1 Tax=Erythrobacter sp. SG61-1L TaxID=1603897 RepID=UPI0006C9321D|nr:MgtC/SapB family protein [Erythrobacter sp. SG61-1L]KPL68788.1 MgtC/SapB family transporter [Erythrobacter sp. SG61-1L]